MSNLSQHVSGVAAKYLSHVDATPKSNQHEIGSNAFARILGSPGANKVTFQGTLLYLTDQDESPLKAQSLLTWYDTRLGNPSRSAEYRLYYQSNPVTQRMTAGDFCVVAIKPDNTLLLVITPAGSTAEHQIRWLFGIGELPKQGFEVKAVDAHREVHLIEATILEALGLEVRRDDEQWLDLITQRYGESFPTTSEFSHFARETSPLGPHPLDEPDETLLHWMEHEEMLFRTLERKMVQRQLDLGFDSVDHFVAFSLSVQNRRKSRVGYALEHHLAAVFQANNLQFGRQVVTEHRATADFLFPGHAQYHDPTYPSDKLLMLASKSSCKDRWRQALTEAQRIPVKHLFTLEAGISEHQTNEMRAHALQLVVPKMIHAAYLPPQQAWLMSLADLIHEIKLRA